MARRRQILADIREFGLNPKVAHKVGKVRLKRPEADAPVEPASKVEEKPVVKDPEPVKVEVEEKKEELEEVKTEDLVEVVEEKPKPKPRRRRKKAAPKDEADQS